MKFDQREQTPVQITQDSLLDFAIDVMGTNNGFPDDDHPLPPGPWDPVIRLALRQISFGPLPDPWKISLVSILARHAEIYDAIGGSHRFGDEVALNPQPLPPRHEFLMMVSRFVIDRAELLQEIADATRQEGTQQGIIIGGGYTRRFVDDWCGTGFRLRWPFPGPRPHWFAHELSGIDLVIIATQFHQAAREAFSPDLRQSLGEASAKFVEAGLSKMH